MTTQTQDRAFFEHKENRRFVTTQITIPICESLSVSWGYELPVYLVKHSYLLFHFFAKHKKSSAFWCEWVWEEALNRQHKYGLVPHAKSGIKMSYLTVGIIDNWFLELREFLLCLLSNFFSHPYDVRLMCTNSWVSSNNSTLSAYTITQTHIKRCFVAIVIDTTL